jgi:hypothetical protein
VLLGTIGAFVVGLIILKRFPVKEVVEEAEEELDTVPGL